MRPLDVRHLPIVLLCLTAAVARISVGSHITDDAYITMRYSRNLSSAGTMSYNPPDAVLGTSSPLWTWVLAAGNVAGAAPEKTAVAAATVADLCSIVLILTGPAARSLMAVASSATIAAWPAYVMYAVSGMETSLYVLLVVAFVTAVSRRQTLGSAAAASLAALCRPDGALLVVLGFMLTWIQQTKRAALRFLAAAALFCTPWAVYALVRFGSIVPSSVSAKASAPDPWFLSFQNLQAYFFDGVYLPLTILALAGFVVIAKKSDASLSVLRIWSVWAWCYLAAMTAANGFTHFPWYFAPLLPIYTAAAAAAVAGAFDAVGGWHLAPKGGWHRWRESGARLALSATGTQTAVAALLGVALLSRMPSLKAHLDAISAGRENLYASVATELSRVDARCTVAATEIGTLGYHYPGRILDLVGLVSPEVIGRPLDAVLTQSGARWLVTYDTHFDRAVVAGQPFSSLFERRTTVRIGDARALEIYERRDRASCGTP